MEGSSYIPVPGIGGGERFPEAVLESLFDDLRFRLRDRSLNLSFTGGAQNLLCTKASLNLEIFRIEFTVDERALFTYKVLEEGALTEKQRNLDPVSDSWMTIVDECKECLELSEKSPMALTELVIGTKNSNGLNGDQLLDGLLQLASSHLKNEARTNENRRDVYNLETNTRLFSVIKTNESWVFEYPQVPSTGVGRFRWCQMDSESVTFQDAWISIKPVVTFCECCLNGMPYREEYVGKLISALKKELRIEIPPCACIELQKNVNYLSQEFIQAVIPMLKEDGAVYYPDYPVKCQFDWKNGKYCLPFFELSGLLEKGSPIVRIVDQTKKPSDGWAPQSVLRQFGYHVDSQANGAPVVSDAKRRAVLSYIIESPYSGIGAERVCEYLRFFLSLGGGPSMERARKRWLEDLSFVANKYLVAGSSSQRRHSRKKHKHKR